MRNEGVIDKEGKKLTTSYSRNGHTHTAWLNLMYPRLRLAKNLLTSDGLIFISIDDREFSSLKLICNEIFGERNFVANLIWQNKKGGGNDSKHFAIEHEYVLVYASDKDNVEPLFMEHSQEYLKRYKHKDSKGKFFWDTFKRKSGKQYYTITCPDGSILDKDENGNPLSWLRSEARFKKDLAEGEIKFEQINGKWNVYFKQRLPKGKKPRSLFLDGKVITRHGTTEAGSEAVKKLFKRDLFDNPKPVELIAKIIEVALKNTEGIILDFFSGSATTAHAVMKLNAEDGGNRKFIMVQLPEPTDEKSEAYKAGYKNICEIGKERIRRAGEQILEEHPEAADRLDVGFKVLKLDSSNIREWNVEFDQLEDEIDLFADTFVDGAREIDIVHEIMLKTGLELTLPIDTFEVDEKNVYDIAYGNLFICLADEINEAVVRAIIERRRTYDIETSTVVLKDTGFANNDSEKLNCFELLKDAGYQDDQLMTI